MDGDAEKENPNEGIMLGRRNAKIKAARHANEDSDRDNGIKETIVDKMMDGDNSTYGNIEHVRRSQSIRKIGKFLTCKLYSHKDKTEFGVFYMNAIDTTHP